MKITALDQDFSLNNIGNSSKMEIYIKNANITNETYKTALRALYAGLKSDLILNKIKAMNLFFAGTALADRINIINPYDNNASGRVEFFNDIPAAHTTSGYQIDGETLRHGRSQQSLLAAGFTNGLSDFGLHCYNNSPEIAGTGNRYLTAYNANQPGASDLYLTLARANQNNSTSGAISSYSAISSITVSGYNDATKIGLLSVVRNGSDAKLYDKGIQIGLPQTTTPNIIINGTERFYLGAIDATSKAAFTTTKILAWAITKGFDAADTLKLSNRLDSFKAALGV